jgi:2-hydroxychromene-2-carboxylate isomerase
MVTVSFDVGSPYAYLALERVARFLPDDEVVVAPVLLGAVFAATGRSSWALTDRRAAGIADVEARAAAYGLPPVVWPDPWPGDGLRAMRAAVHAVEQGCGLAFARAALRVAFRDGANLATADAIARAAAAAGLDIDATLAATRDPSCKRALRERTERAIAEGVRGVPTWTVRGVHHWGDDQLETALSAREESPA